MDGPLELFLNAFIRLTTSTSEKAELMWRKVIVANRVIALINVVNYPQLTIGQL